MIKAYFSSEPNTDLLKIVDDFLQEALVLAQDQNSVGLDIMLFSFTDEALLERLKQIIASRKIKLRIIADWGNISNRDNRQLLNLLSMMSESFQLRFKFDLPYLWDEQAQKLRWSYHASLGLLHHKSVCIRLKDESYAMLCGSLNWTKTGGNNYENLLRIGTTTPAEKSIVSAMMSEFEAIWQHPKLCLNYAEASLLRANVKRWYKLNPAAEYSQMQGNFLGDKNSNTNREPTTKTRENANAVIAFSSNEPFGQNRQKGLATENANRQFAMQKPSGKSKWVPLDIQTVALDMIYSAQAGEELCLCMYAFSPRVPEYTALLEMARKGVKVRCILDRSSNKGMIEKLKEVALKEGLDIIVKSGSRGMHQKYMVNQSAKTLICGTANMSTDSYYRHFEHRLLIRAQKGLTGHFQADFERLWRRISD